MKQLTTLTFIFISSLSYGQDATIKTDKAFYDMVEVAPELPDGISSYYDYVEKNLKYPEQSKNQGIEGRVYIQFVVDETGNIVPESVSTVKGINEEMNAEGERLIKEMKNWIPGRLVKDGDPVKVRMILPVKFSLAVNN